MTDGAGVHDESVFSAAASQSAWTDFDRPFERGLSVSKQRRTRSSTSRRSHHEAATKKTTDTTPRSSNSGSEQCWMEAPSSCAAGVPVIRAPSPSTKKHKSSSTSTARDSSNSRAMASPTSKGEEGGTSTEQAATSQAARSRTTASGSVTNKDRRQGTITTSSITSADDLPPPTSTTPRSRGTTTSRTNSGKQPAQTTREKSTNRSRSTSTTRPREDMTNRVLEIPSPHHNATSNGSIGSSRQTAETAHAVVVKRKGPHPRLPLSPTSGTATRGRSSHRGTTVVANTQPTQRRDDDSTPRPQRSSSSTPATRSSTGRSRSRSSISSNTSSSHQHHSRGRSLTNSITARINNSSNKSNDQHHSRSASTSSKRNSAATKPRHPPLTKENFHRKVRSRSTSLTRVTNTATAQQHQHPDQDVRSLPPMHNVQLQQQPQQQSSASSLMEKLFGNPVDKKRLTAVRQNYNAITGSLGQYEIRPRILLAATVYHNTASDLWITTINTNQRGISKNPIIANKFLKAFSFPTELEARESAIANAPPKMVSKLDAPYCFCCKGNFAVFRRAGHCRNCGVCICNNCSVHWHRSWLPDTYNLKHENKTLRICISCNALAASFKKALLDGDLEEAIAIYGTGNVNLRTPFPVVNKKDELMYPVHCAVEGGNLGILHWLIDDHFCPIKIFSSSSSSSHCNNSVVKRSGLSRRTESLIVTSKNRSVLTIALDSTNVDMLRYLVVDCGLNLQDVRGDVKTTVRALEAALYAMPTVLGQLPTNRPTTPHCARWDHASFDEFSEPSSLGADEHLFGDVESTGMVSTRSARTSSSSRHNNNGTDSCIICCDRKIDCVATPCGHQVCCLTCSANLTSCPVCNDRTSFIKIFRP